MQPRKLTYPDGQEIEIGDRVFIAAEKDQGRVIQIVDTEELRHFWGLDDFGIIVFGYHNRATSSLELADIIEYGVQLIARDPPEDPDFYKVCKIYYVDGKRARWRDRVFLSDVGKPAIVTGVCDSKRWWGLPEGSRPGRYEYKYGLCVEIVDIENEAAAFRFIEIEDVKKAGVRLISRGEKWLWPRRPRQGVPPEKAYWVVKLPEGVTLEVAQERGGDLKTAPIGTRAAIAARLLQETGFRLVEQYYYEEEIEIEIRKLTRMAVPRHTAEEILKWMDKNAAIEYMVVEYRAATSCKPLRYLFYGDPVTTFTVKEKDAPFQELYRVLKLLEKEFGPFVIRDERGRFFLPKQLST